MDGVYLLALLFAFNFCFVLSDNDESIICDNGKENIEVDLLPAVDLQCPGKSIVISEYIQPAGKSSCTERDKIVNGEPVCMNTPLSYSPGTIVTSGNYRPLAPQYGEYSYLPPQRWLHALKYGAIVFLYHPCAPLDQVMELKRLARSCLWKHIITPSNLLSMDEPFALVSYGCLFTMKWVEPSEVNSWIQHHALQTPESVFIQNGLYNHGLIEASYIVSTPNDSIICSSNTNEGEDNTPPSGSNGNNNTVPTITTPTPTLTDNNITSPEPILNTTSSTSRNCSLIHHGDTFQCTKHNYIVVVLHNYPLLYGLVVLVGVVILTLGSFLLCVGLYKHGLLNRNKKRVGRYKPCGQFYIGGKEGASTGIAIPELGLPKTIPSEREKLLLESDEDDL